MVPSVSGVPVKSCVAIGWAGDSSEPRSTELATREPIEPKSSASVGASTILPRSRAKPLASCAAIGSEAPPPDDVPPGVKV